MYEKVYIIIHVSRKRKIKKWIGYLNLIIKMK